LRRADHFRQRLVRDFWDGPHRLVRTPRGELRYARELANAAAPSTAAFIDVPATPFTIHSVTLGRDAAMGSVGILGAVGARLVLSADYRAAFETNHHSQAVVLGVAF
jgi:uncharacterized protein with beta-barrel porin domain